MKYHHWLIIYDIFNPKRLRRIEKAVSQYGTRVQKSVFEINAGDNIIGVLQKKLEAIIEEDDSVVIIPLCEQDWQKKEKHGIITPSRYMDGDYVIL